MEKPRRVPTQAEARKKYPHGTNARYHMGRCRCTPCRAAAKAYQQRLDLERRPWRKSYSKSKKLWVVKNELTREVASSYVRESAADRCVERLNAKAESEAPRSLVPVLVTRQHIAFLQSRGVGMKTIAKASGVAYSVLERIATGQIKRTRRQTEKKILAVEPETTIKSGARVRADETIVLIDRLIAAGYARSQIAHELGKSSHLQIARSTPWVSVRNAQAVHALYVRLQADDARLPAIDTTFRLGIAESTFSDRRGGLKPRSGKRAHLSPIRLAAHPHGTNARYEESNCRCRRCAAAHVAFKTALEARRRVRYAVVQTPITRVWRVTDVDAGSVVFQSADRAEAFAVRDEFNRTDPTSYNNMLVDPGPARRRVQELLAGGASSGDIAKAAGVDTGAVWHLLRARRVRQSTASAILGVREDLPPNGNVCVDASPTWELLDRLVAAGFEPSWLSTILGSSGWWNKTRRRTIRVHRARAVLALYGTLRERVTLVQQLEATRTRAA